MNFDDTQLLDCAHVGILAGICQYDGCANKTCEQCIDICDKCRIVLCPDHQNRPGNDAPIFCRDHLAGYALKQLFDTITDR